MKSIASNFLKAYCPSVDKVTYDGSSLEVHFSDKTISVVNDVSEDNVKYATLQAIVKRTYADDIKVNGYVSSFLENTAFKDLFSLIEYPKKGISVKSKISKSSVISIPKKLSKIATLLNSESYSVKSYERPNKPFKDFTPSEKRAYWRAANKRRKSKNS